MYETKPYFYGTGRRKHSVARVRVYNGTGKVTINGRDIDDYFGLDTLKLHGPSAPWPSPRPTASLTSLSTLSGGGCSGQAGAIRHGRGPRPAAVRSPTCVPCPEEGWLPHPRSSYEGT